MQLKTWDDNVDNKFFFGLRAFIFNLKLMR